MSQSPSIRCPACDRSYRVRAEIAGRKVKCKCGHVLRMPEMSASSSASQGAYGLDDAPSAEPRQARCPNCGQSITPTAVLCINCGFNIKAGKRVETTVLADDDSLPTAAALAPAASPNLGGQFAAASQTSDRRAKADAESRAESEKSHVMQEYIVPLILVVLGLIALPIRGYIAADSPTIALIFIGVYTVTQIIVPLPFLFIGILLTARIMQTSFGPLTTAILKLVALAVFISGVIGLLNDVIDLYTMGLGRLFIGYIFELVAFWALCAYFFSLDVMETFVLWFIAIFVAGWAKVAIFVVLFAMLF